jgi:hypothetical protein
LRTSPPSYHRRWALVAEPWRDLSHNVAPSEKKNLGSCKEQTVSLSEQISNRQCLVPKLNIAIPSPASDNIDIDPFIIEGIWMFHLKFSENKMC